MSDEETTGRLVRLGGMRPDAAPDRERRVRQAFLDECRTVARTRVLRRRLAIVVAALAIPAAALVTMRVSRPQDVPTPVPGIAAPVIAATVERLEGTAVRRTGTTVPVRLASGDPLHTGDQIEAGVMDRVGVRLTNGASLRLDRASRARLISANRIQLEAGGLYVDSGSDTSGRETSRPDTNTRDASKKRDASRPDAGRPEASSPDAASLEIVTPLGIVRDIGTQFEIRLEDASLRVRVRSGRVDLQRGSEVTSARPGTELIVERGRPTIRPVAPYGEAWAWTERLAPPFEIEGRPLAAFLDHISREQGWTLSYATPTLARETSGIILHGSTAGMPSSDALAIVLKTSGMTHTITGGVLEVARISRP